MVPAFDARLAVHGQRIQRSHVSQPLAGTWPAIRYSMDRLQQASVGFDNEESLSRVEDRIRSFIVENDLLLVFFSTRALEMVLFSLEHNPESWPGVSWLIRKFPLARPAGRVSPFLACLPWVPAISRNGMLRTG